LNHASTNAMKKEDNYLAINQQAWDAKTGYHAASDFYDVPGFLAGRNTLNAIELGLLGDVRGKTVLHLQCHFGQDTLSLSRMGAVATGVDFSGTAIAKGRELATQLELNTTFICADVYSLPDVLNQQFDIIFTSYGTIGWLPDLDRWAAVVARFLKPGGRFVFAEFHPVVWMFDNDFTKITYSYFKEEAIVEQKFGTYAETGADISNETISWNHSLSEVLGGLLHNGLVIEQFKEYDYSPYSCFNHLEEFAPGKFRVKHLGNNIPMVYAILAIKK
jgi:ubiquinone/menaquinone biosynthesis C-methylase UbiE